MNAKEKIIEKIIRVDQAGEVGAQRIYEGCLLYTSPSPRD